MKYVEELTVNCTITFQQKTKILKKLKKKNFIDQQFNELAAKVTGKELHENPTKMTIEK